MKLSYLFALLTATAMAAPNGGVLDNDTDPDGDAVTSAVLVDLPQNGALTFNQNGTFVYTPNENFFGLDAFTYRPIDETGMQGESTTVTITVKAKGDPPVGVPDAYETDEDTPLVVPPPVANSGYGGDVLTAASGAGNSAVWNFVVADNPGMYRVSATWPPDPGATDKADYIVSTGRTMRTVRVDQRAAPDSFAADGADWKELATVNGKTSIAVILTGPEPGGLLMADAVRIERTGADGKAEGVPRVRMPKLAAVTRP